MSGYDHAVRAREILDAAVDLTNSIEESLAAPLIDGNPGEQLAEIRSREASAETRFGLVGRLHEAAQVHATLALVDQQRVANLLVLNDQLSSTLDALTGVHGFVDDVVGLGQVRDGVKQQIVDGLDLRGAHLR